MKVLLMFSGGKDSFIAACKLVEQGYKTYLMMFNSGCIASEENVLHSSQRLRKRYGNEIEMIGIRSTMATHLRISRPWKEFSVRDLSSRYPDVTGVQSQCFFCQTSMWIEAIAYCKAHNINKIATGYKSSDTFCTGNKQYLDFIREIASEYNIEVELPMWNFIDTKDGLDKRDQEMCARRFLPSVLEPKCTVGLPAKHKISDKEVEQLINYIKEYIDYIEMINKSSEILKHIKITNKSLE